jgi:hypothetical protein
MKDYKLKQRNLRASHTLGWVGRGTGTPKDKLNLLQIKKEKRMSVYSVWTYNGAHQRNAHAQNGLQWRSST